MAGKTTGAGTFDCPSCHRTVRFVVDIEVDAENRAYSSRVKSVSDDHAPDCKITV